jgi:hypothetical protein
MQTNSANGFLHQWRGDSIPIVVSDSELSERAVVMKESGSDPKGKKSICGATGLPRPHSYFSR